MSDEGETFETADAGASTVYPMQCGDIRKGSYVMIKGKACKVVDYSTSKTGKHGHAKSHNVEIPFVKHTEYQLLSADPDSGDVSLLMESGETKDDLNLPSFAKQGEPTDDDKKVSDQIVKEQEGDKTVYVKVLSAIGQEKIVEVMLK